MRMLLKIVGAIAALLILIWIGGTLLTFHRTFSPTEYSPQQVRELCGPVMGVEGFQLTDADALDHAWQGDHWLDASLFCRMKTTPERVRALKAAIFGRQGAVWSGWKTEVLYTAPDCQGDEYTCLHYGEMSKQKRPDWWKTEGLPQREWFSVTETHAQGANTHGVNYVISEPEGLVFAERWRT